jgi:hypothetical protein
MTLGEMRDRIAAVRTIRAENPSEVRRRLQSRPRRELLSADGRLMLIAADHPARGALGVRDQPFAMASRSELLARLATALSRPGVDGIVATADIIDDLVLMDVLDNKIVIGSMNRGGIQGATFELDDRFTGYDSATIADNNFDGGKMLCRICLSDPTSVSTLESCGRAITELANSGLMAMIEPFWSERRGDRVVNDLSTSSVVKSVAIAAGLGARSEFTWLKLPAVDGLEDVMEATTLPTLLLGGDPSGHPEQTYDQWERSLAVPGVRGLVIGRALLYPPDGDVAAAVDVSAELVHGTDVSPLHSATG